MSEHARDRILSKLYAARQQADTDAAETACLPIEHLDKSDKIEKLKRLMEAVRSEIHVVRTDAWVDKLREILRQRQVKSLLYAPQTEIGEILNSIRDDPTAVLPELIAYQQDVEEFKEKLFHIDAGITSTVGAIAETGAIILWPTEAEPRLMSLVPPIHIAVLKAEKIYNTFCEVIQAENWPQKMPTNVLLISGPSKTADIELVLAFGVHGPKELIVIIIND